MSTYNLRTAEGRNALANDVHAVLSKAEKTKTPKMGMADIAKKIKNADQTQIRRALSTLLLEGSAGAEGVTSHTVYFYQKKRPGASK